MKKILLIMLTFVAFNVNAQEQKIKIKNKVVQVACGICKFGLEGDSCELAVKINDRVYFVEGTKLDSHGDTHAHDGFCNAFREAKVTGEVKDWRTFVVTSFELLPYKE